MDANGLANPQNYDPQHRPRRQDFSPYFVENGAFYISQRKTFLECQSRLFGRICAYEMCEETYFEIDEPAGWVIVENPLEKITQPN